MSSAPTVAIVAPGEMGAAIGARLAHSGCTVLTELEGRSARTIQRAQAAGLQNASLAEIAQRSEWILSVLPPSEARTLAERIRAVWPAGSGRRVVYVDCNAVNPETARAIGEVLRGVSGLVYLDGSIIGGPPSAPGSEKVYDPTIYASAAPKDLEVLQDFVKLGETYNLRVVPLKGEGAGIGDASALKMSYAGISKGMIGLFTTMILAAHASSPATAQALIQELSHSQPTLLQRLTGSIPPMLPKAYRFVGEMEEISQFVGGGGSQVHAGFADTYRRVEASMAEGKEGGKDVRVLKEFVEEAKHALEK